MIKRRFSTVATVLLFVFSACATAAFAAPPPPVLDENSPGTILVFPKFDIRSGTSTQLRIVNNGVNLTNVNGDVADLRVKINYVCPGVKHVNEFCAALDRTYTFTPNQTRIIDVAADHPPCNQGYVIAYPLTPVVTSVNMPVSYNYLSGSYHIYEGAKHSADNAIAIQSLQPDGTGLTTNPTFLPIGSTYFKGISTNLYTDFLSTSEKVDSGSRLTLLTLDVLAGMQNPPAVAAIDFWNAAEVPFSTSTEFICWQDKELADIDANFIEDNLGTRHGSMIITTIANCPLPGGCPPLEPYDATLLGAITEWGDGTSGSRTLSHDQVAKSTNYYPR